MAAPAAAAPAERRVFVLGPDPSLDVARAVHAAVVENAQLVLLTVGFDVTPGQDLVVREALRLAEEERVWLQVEMVTALERLPELVQASDDVTILAVGQEGRRIERALGSSNGSAPDEPAALWQERAEGPQLRPVLMRSDQATAPSGPSGAGEPPPPSAEGESVEALAGREVAAPAKEVAWTREGAESAKRGALRVYLGAAPGVGKTYAMLSEGKRRKARGTDVVVGVVQTYGRAKTIEMAQGLEVIPPRSIDYRGTSFEELDVEALVERRPEVALVDELAHTNIPGSRRAKRWEDVVDVLAEGITVITTLNVQHLASVNDVVAEVTGIRQQETVPDWVLDLADDVELVDMSPTALQRRMMHGNIYPDPRKAELALRRFFTTENLTALRELALMRVANQVDEALLARWRRERTPETRERIMVAVSGRGSSEALIRRAARIAQRTQGELLVVHVDAGTGRAPAEELEALRSLSEELGGTLHVLPAEDPVEALLSFAYQQHVTQIVVGEQARTSRWQQLTGGSFVDRLIRRAANIDIHVMARSDR